jgi:hypothetical protein
MSTGKVVLWLFVVGFLGWYGFGLVFPPFPTMTASPAAKSLPFAMGQHSVQGPPTVTVAKMHQLLCDAGSPACGQEQELYNEGVAANINPAYAMAFFKHESSFGTAGMAMSTRSLGNLRCYNGAACSMVNGGYASFGSWSDGFQAWYNLINNLYIKQWHANTVETIIPHYAPSSDGNNEQGYIDAVVSDVQAWSQSSQTGGLKVTRIDQNDSAQYVSVADYKRWSPSACSAAAITAVFNYYGNTHTLAQVLKTEIDNGDIASNAGLLTHEGIAHTATSYNFNATLNESDNLDNVIATANAGHPVIVNWPPDRFSGGHFVVVRGGNADTVYLADSSSYNYPSLPRATFLGYWAGFSAVLTP